MYLSDLNLEYLLHAYLLVERVNSLIRSFLNIFLKFHLLPYPVFPNNDIGDTRVALKRKPARRKRGDTCVVLKCSVSEGGRGQCAGGN